MDAERGYRLELGEEVRDVLFGLDVADLGVAVRGELVDVEVAQVDVETQTKGSRRVVRGCRSNSVSGQTGRLRRVARERVSVPAHPAQLAFRFRPILDDQKAL